MLCYMRSFEIHLFETGSDLELALQGGIVTPERVASTTCSECDESVAYSGEPDKYVPFALTIDEDDHDWVLCVDCASPILDHSEIFSIADSVDLFTSDDLDFF